MLCVRRVFSALSVCPGSSAISNGWVARCRVISGLCLVISFACTCGYVHVCVIFRRCENEYMRVCVNIEVCTHECIYVCVCVCVQLSLLLPLDVSLP